jgi:hypothetical protein
MTYLIFSGLILVFLTSVPISAHVTRLYSMKVFPFPCCESISLVSVSLRLLEFLGQTNFFHRAKQIKFKNLEIWFLFTNEPGLGFKFPPGPN